MNCSWDIHIKDSYLVMTCSGNYDFSELQNALNIFFGNVMKPGYIMFCLISYRLTVKFPTWISSVLEFLSQKMRKAG